MENVVYCEIVKYDKGGNPYRTLQAYEIINGTRRAIESTNKPNGHTAKEK